MLTKRIVYPLISVLVLVAPVALFDKFHQQLKLPNLLLPNLLMLAALYSFVQLVTSVPDTQAYSIKRDYPSCLTCQRPKPRLMHHCRLCGNCNYRLDHHCLWAANCIAVDNLRDYIRALIWALLLSFSIIAVSIRGILRLLDDKRHRSGWLAILLLVLAVAEGLLSWALARWIKDQIWAVRDNQTTLQTYKFTGGRKMPFFKSLMLKVGDPFSLLLPWTSAIPLACIEQDLQAQ